ncbi:contact-dependent growth inhibition system immunity protein [Streptomyces sp. Li-HN-5-11]|uniref:contact-dependent growth inhibition system immunity protein n=1 Tax=Streptomyces sp. Li-HN-5-11 TaxID=3075432 RepID=UPI0028AC6498|nr:contact-dependent growth inhibition system immunity protein [Streptomyces sp. Li-HN-5-11]WNM31203.1 contact-dependent growth inhibition system immunity protein [Streptomyces sp. Li-HN-5-11]
MGQKPCSAADEWPAEHRTQQVALPYVLPLAVRLMVEEPLLDAFFYEGDLLLAAVNAPAQLFGRALSRGFGKCLQRTRRSVATSSRSRWNSRDEA